MSEYDQEYQQPITLLTVISQSLFKLCTRGVSPQEDTQLSPPAWTLQGKEWQNLCCPIVLVVLWKIWVAIRQEIFLLLPPSLRQGELCSRLKSSV